MFSLVARCHLRCWIEPLHQRDTMPTRPMQHLHASAMMPGFEFPSGNTELFVNHLDSLRPQALDRSEANDICGRPTRELFEFGKCGEDGGHGFEEQALERHEGQRSRVLRRIATPSSSHVACRCLRSLTST